MEIPKIRIGGLPQEGIQQSTETQSRTTGFSSQDMLETADQAGIIDDGDLFQLPGEDAGIIIVNSRSADSEMIGDNKLAQAGIIVVDGGITDSPQAPGQDAGIIIIDNKPEESR